MEQLISFIESLKTNLRLSSYGEEATKQSLVLPLLNMLGWNVFNVEEVMPELTIENGVWTTHFALEM
jgi:predicted type IV restriction endonuclease